MTDPVIEGLAERIVRAFEEAPTFTAAKEAVQGVLEDLHFEHRKEVVDLRLRLYAAQDLNRRKA